MISLTLYLLVQHTSWASRAAEYGYPTSGRYPKGELLFGTHRDAACVERPTDERETGARRVPEVVESGPDGRAQM
jgi:hypothetical protein